MSVENGRAVVSHDPAAADSLADAKLNLGLLAREAAARLEPEVAAGIRRTLSEQGEYLQTGVRLAIDHYAARRLAELLRTG